MMRFSGMEPRAIDWERLDRYVTGEGTPEELEALRRWVEGDDELQVVAEVMRTAHRRPEAMPEAWNPTVSWNTVSQRLGLTSDDGLPAVELRAPRRAPPRAPLRLIGEGRWRRWVSWPAIAAAVAAVVVVAVGGDRWVEARASAVTVGGGGREYVALRGQRLVVHLPDRTQVTLAPETKLRLSPAYGHGARAVELEGQAYFIVTHDATRPFSVRTDRLVARDLGTRFVVRAYPGDSMPNVLVAEGKVSLGTARPDAADSVVLEAGDLGRLTKSGTFVLQHNAPVERLLDWTAGDLVFRGTPLSDAVVELGRWYDVDIRLADSALGREQVTASFRDESASTAIGLVAAAAGLAVEQDGTRFVFLRKRESSPKP